MRWALNLAGEAHLWATPKRPLVEFFRDPWLTVACVLLVVVSLGWIVVTRLIAHRMRKAIRHKGRYARPGDKKKVWSSPP